MKTDILIVGAGLSGIALARRYAEENANVLIVERRSHIGGDCYDYFDENGICIHKYGPHIFRTDDKSIYDYLSQFTEWYDYQHRVMAYTGGGYYPIPINLDTVNRFLGSNYDSNTVMQYFNEVRTHPHTIDNIKDAIESQVGTLFYETFFKSYTYKQWGIEPEKLPPSIISRIPIRTNRDNRYFTVKYQGIPKEGYTAMMKNMLDHQNIKIMLNTNFKDICEEITYDKLYYSGSIDEYFDYVYGKLPYRCVSFKLETYNISQYQETAVVNYPNDYEYTRITEFKHFYPRKTNCTVIAKEYPSNIGNPSYPIPTVNNLNLYNKYKKLVQDEQINFIGRLGLYKYFSMDQILKSILNIQL